MGRLSFGNSKSRLLKQWALPIITASIILVSIHIGLFAHPKPGLDRLQEYLRTNQLQVGVDVVEGYQQVYYFLDGTKFYLTDTASNHTGVSSSGEYVIWQESINGNGQIFIHNTLAKTTVRLTALNNNTHHQLSAGRVVWESISEINSQVFYYNGLDTLQLSDPQAHAIRPSIQHDQVIFAEKTGSIWQTKLYNAASKEARTMASGTEHEAGWPRFIEDRIETKFQ